LVTNSCATIPAIAIIAYDDDDYDGENDDDDDVILTRRPLFSSFVFIVTLSLSVFGIKPRGSKLRSPGIWSAFNVATPTCGIGPHPAPLLLIVKVIIVLISRIV